MLKAVIFDFDGVITDSEVLHLRAFNEVLKQFGVELPTKDYYKEYLGLTDIDCFNLVAQQNELGLDNGAIHKLVRRKNEIFEDLAQSEGRTIEGVPEFLRLLHGNDVPMAICSGALLAEIELLLEQAKLRHFFSIIVSAEQVKKGKPDPAGFLLALHKLNEGRKDPIEAEQCIVVEDSRWGLEAARRAGMHTVAVTNSYGPEQLMLAEKIVARLDALSIGDLQALCA